MANQPTCRGQCKQTKSSCPTTSASSSGKNPNCPSKDCKNPECTCTPSIPFATPLRSSNAESSKKNKRACICSNCICSPCLDLNKQKSCPCKGPPPKKNPNICEEYPEILLNKPTYNINNTVPIKDPYACCCKVCKSKKCNCKPEIPLPPLKLCDCETCRCNPCKRYTPKSIYCECPDCKSPRCQCKPKRPVLTRKPCDCMKCICDPCRDPNVFKPCSEQQGYKKKPCNDTSCIISKYKTQKVCASKVVLKQPFTCSNKTCPSTTPNVSFHSKSAAACSFRTCRTGSNQSITPCDCPICKCEKCNDKNIPPKKPCAALSNEPDGTEKKLHCTCKDCICPACVDPKMRMNKKAPCSCQR